MKNQKESQESSLEIAFRRIDIEKGRPMCRNSDRPFQRLEETEILRSEPKRFRKRAEERIKAIDDAIEKERVARASKQIK